ncbi:MAG: 2-amino-4-hydroxy-6-hydroxymethyldihydropteridine diphosphokinase [Leptolinea sp.]|nr:2-amino-4-hydroxy-6-hydroxymethyldihydropteridine diphosphokinase [Leptolinea sp.]
MGKVVVLLGSNIDPAINIRQGARLLSEKVNIIHSSSVWITPAEGTSGPDFYNAAVLCETPMTEETLKLNILRPLEELLGRVRTHDKFAPRTIDMDVIIKDGKILDARLWNTAFILLPIAEIASDLRDPSTGKSIRELAKAMEPISGARKKDNFPLFQ